MPGIIILSLNAWKRITSYLSLECLRSRITNSVVHCRGLSFQTFTNCNHSHQKRIRNFDTLEITSGWSSRPLGYMIIKRKQRKMYQQLNEKLVYLPWLIYMHGILSAIVIYIWLSSLFYQMTHRLLLHTLTIIWLMRYTLLIWIHSTELLLTTIIVFCVIGVSREKYLKSLTETGFCSFVL